MPFQSFGKWKEWDSTGAPLSGGKIYFYSPGTTTLKNTYSDQEGTIANTNPVVLDSRGEASVWTVGLYDIKVTDSTDVTIYTQDGVGVDSISITGSALVTDYGAVGDGVTDDTAAFSAAAADSKYVRVPYSASGYNVSSSVSANGATFIFEGGFVGIQLTGTATRDDLNAVSINNGQITCQRVRIEPEDSTLTGTNEGEKRGLFIHQTEPDTTSVDYGDGPWAFNEVSCNWSGERTGSGIYGGSASAAVTSFAVSMTVGGADYEVKSARAISAGVIHSTDDTCDGDKVAMVSGISSSASTSGNMYGCAASYTLNTGASTPFATGMEVGSYINDSNLVVDAFGVNALSAGDNTSSRSHAAYALTRSGAAGAVPWRTGFLLYSASGTLSQAIATDGSLFKSDAAALIGSVFDFSNVTVADYIMNFPNVTLTGGGSLTCTYIKTSPVTVANLTAAATAGAGARSFVTDSTTSVFGATVSGGGALAVPVYSNGVNWLVG